ncbi:aspartate carbamoyltransferase catalytic subunit [Desulfovibrio litoralis]|uniref:Aspartate carbamoyltransferase n=1 Tax=Desulfovibrio litoralis DSM 11393 TaxID=1121455 RepID=A0A1M7SDK9_9BACT|nr:aspartate carbamoyltransferase catalytic subunit [Desulfovibrio litoralis]SHN56573.1 aspartate carbamoyltransferase [Desulfovibrio litoralis DSM 11393]
MQTQSYVWKHKDLIDVTALKEADVMYLLDNAEQFYELNTRPIKKVPTLRGKSVIMFFVEPSTRTKTSFDVAGKRLSADTFSLAKSGSSISKGESLKDTALTLEAMTPDAIVIRHSASGAAQFLAERLDCSVINAGDGWHAHPTQALLDCFCLRRYFKSDFTDKKVLILGDIAHSRVARSNIHLLTMLGVKIKVCAPSTLLPRGIEEWGVEVFTDLDKASKDVDAIMCLRLQLERQQAGLLPDLNEYSKRYCLTQKHLENSGNIVKVLHPGPINRGLEISSELADSPESLILEQVAAGVATRMSILFALLTRNEKV